MDVHHTLEPFDDSPVTDLSSVCDKACTLNRPYKKGVVIGDEFAGQFYGMYSNRSANGQKVLGVDEWSLHV